MVAKANDNEAAKQSVAEELRSLMARKQVTGRELARRLGQSDHRWVTNRMNGKTSVAAEDIPLLAAGLGMTPQELGRALVDQLPEVELDD
ncbi:helix-turn-helix transcriptional regulator [Gordonia sp. ABSL1-1]|uniref:helix-turn-helix domain-containing protein n=1 Tax=Gordonia sp. ABSL1-1 TaxID=3053923 RepID=UPI0025746000|nr:helix-turn-helix transcriptional regulator [Gordonia sp. ABSL1-1]MDL9938663.1 helix-turn-helix transcriptional regulator [Gordonia sp. ABSL1-1]